MAVKNRFKTLVVILLAAAVATAIYAFRFRGSRSSGNPPIKVEDSSQEIPSTGPELHSPGPFLGHNYSTTFPGAEDPLSERAIWVGGEAAGATCDHHSCWGNMQTLPGQVFGVSEPTQFGDPTAILTGPWEADQTVEGTVVVQSGQPWRGCCHELELRLRTTISANTITGYEVYCSLIWSNRYCHVASWGGPNGSYVNLDECLGHTPALYLKNGDILKATISGTQPVTITAFVNGSQIMQILDEGTCTFSDGKKHGRWISGNPGIGQYDSSDSDFRSFGWSHFSATDDSVPPFQERP